MPPSAEVLLAAAGGVLLVSLLIAFISTRRERVALSQALSPPSSQAPAPGSVPAVGPWVAFRTGLSRTREVFADGLRSALGHGRDLDGWLADLEEALVLADVGVSTAHRLVGGLRRRSGLESAASVLAALKDEVRGLLGPPTERAEAARPLVILVTGVNGVGKTTTIGKLAQRYQQEGKRVLMVAADTFRAAAIEQLEVWATRVGCEIVKHQHGSDPSAVAFDGVKAGRGRNADVVIIDTAGRLHVKAHLMEELKKIVRVIGRELPGAPHEAFLVLDGSTGQNALSQARLFRDAIALTGIILTKMDGTAKGGVALAIHHELGLPIRYIGLGEGVDDLRPFDRDAFTDALFDPASG